MGHSPPLFVPRFVWRKGDPTWRNGKGKGMIGDALNYPVLTCDAQLREGDKPSRRRLSRADEDSNCGSYGFAPP